MMPLATTALKGSFPPLVTPFLESGDIDVAEITKEESATSPAARSAAQPA
jgi:hypothetical protein